MKLCFHSPITCYLWANRSRATQQCIMHKPYGLRELTANNLGTNHPSSNCLRVGEVCEHHMPPPIADCGHSFCRAGDRHSSQSICLFVHSNLTADSRKLAAVQPLGIFDREKGQRPPLPLSRTARLGHGSRMHRHFLELPHPDLLKPPPSCKYTLETHGVVAACWCPTTRKVSTSQRQLLRRYSCS